GPRCMSQQPPDSENQQIFERKLNRPRSVNRTDLNNVSIVEHRLQIQRRKPHSYRVSQQQIPSREENLHRQRRRQSLQESAKEVLLERKKFQTKIASPVAARWCTPPALTSHVWPPGALKFSVTSSFQRVQP
ncbi:unnamed protein product, partial [Trichogramma brassicae]